jgi:hypothetical protein
LPPPAPPRRALEKEQAEASVVAQELADARAALERSEVRSLWRGDEQSRAARRWRADALHRSRSIPASSNPDHPRTHTIEHPSPLAQARAGELTKELSEARDVAETLRRDMRNLAAQVGGVRGAGSGGGGLQGEGRSGAVPRHAQPRGAGGRGLAFGCVR